jgi:hypothetical protein
MNRLRGGGVRHESKELSKTTRAVRHGYLRTLGSS